MQGMSKMHKPEAVFRIRGNKIFWGPGLMELLAKVDETGSVKAASKEMYMSYAKARRLIALAESELGYSLTAPSRGGASRGGTALTEEGRKYLENCSSIQNELQTRCEELYKRYFQKNDDV